MKITKSSVSCDNCEKKGFTVLKVTMKLAEFHVCLACYRQLRHLFRVKIEKGNLKVKTLPDKE